jgi:hypothetical protein
MEWIGWYFELMCRQLLSADGFQIPGEKIGKICFDGKRSANWGQLAKNWPAIGPRIRAYCGQLAATTANN